MSLSGFRGRTGCFVASGYDPRVFGDFEADGIDVDWDRASDREVLHGIWARLEIGDLNPADGWAALFDRYPDDLRFLLLLCFEQLAAAERSTLDMLLRQATRLEADARLREPIADLLSLVRLARRDELRGAAGAGFETLAGRHGGARRDENEATGRLRKLEWRVLEECHDRTLGGRPLVAKRKASEMRPEDWSTLVETTREKPEKPYAATARFAVGDKVRHPTLGLGFVTAKREKKIDLLFESGRKTLMSG